MRVFRSAPQDLRRRTCPRPNHVVQIDGVGLLTPHVDLAAENQMGGIWRDVGQRIVGVYEAPVLGWGAVVCERVKVLKRGRVGVEPLAFAAVKVLNIGQS